MSSAADGIEARVGAWNVELDMQEVSDGPR